MRDSTYELDDVFLTKSQNYTKRPAKKTKQNRQPKSTPRMASQPPSHLPPFAPRQQLYEDFTEPQWPLGPTNRPASVCTCGATTVRDFGLSDKRMSTVTEEQRGLSWERRDRMSQKERARKALTGTWDDVVVPGLSAISDAKRGSMVFTF